MATSMANLNIQSTVKLNNDVRMPILGLGVYQSPPRRVTRNAVNFALRIGYRHVDTARIYGNEADVGEAVRESGVPRGDLFVTTKLWNSDQGYDSTLRACEASLKTRIGLFGPLSRALPSAGCSQRVLERNGDAAQEGEMPSDWSQQLHHPTSRRVDRREPCHAVRKPG